MHERTLNRRLAAEGTNFRRIREDVRLEAACQLLENSDRPVFQVADVLGYSDATAFTRAFRRWAGVSPAQWRRERDQDRRDA
jgi:AraC-like DNA-binding protein